MTNHSSPEEDSKEPPLDVESLEDLIGKQWCFKIEIVGAYGLPVAADEAYVAYNFFGEECITESVAQNTISPVWNYNRVHCIEHVTQEFISWLTTESMIFKVHINPFIAKFPESISSVDPKIIEALTGKKNANKTKSSHNMKDFEGKEYIYGLYNLLWEVKH